MVEGIVKLRQKLHRKRYSNNARLYATIGSEGKMLAILSERCRRCRLLLTLARTCYFPILERTWGWERRGYPDSLVEKELRKVDKVKRDTILTIRKNRDAQQRVPLALTYSRYLPNITAIQQAASPAPL